MKLLCVRHGEANTADIDPERGLTLKGKEEVTSIAQYLQASQMNVDHIIHSGKRRAFETAEIFGKELGVSKLDQAQDLLGEESEVEPLAQMISAWTDNTMLVGHLPFMAQLVSRLVVGDPAIYPIVNFPPGAVVCLDQNENNRWIIDWCLRPSIVARLNRT